MRMNIELSTAIEMRPKLAIGEIYQTPRIQPVLDCF